MPGSTQRRLSFGTLADLTMLDLRSHRSRQVAPTDTARPRRPSAHPHRPRTDGPAQGRPRARHRHLEPDRRLRAAILELNPHLQWGEAESHGCGVLDVTAARVQMDWYKIADRTDPDSTPIHLKSFTVDGATKRMAPATTPVRRRTPVISRWRLVCGR